MPLLPEDVRAVPKVMLHDHLDGGLRPQTVIELADAVGYTALPATEPTELGRWFLRAADSGSLVRYLETFAHTVAVLQTEAALVRVASECAQDLAADGVVYAEVRYAPELNTAGGLPPEAVVEAVQQGFDQGMAAARAVGRPIHVGTLLCALRNLDAGMQAARLVQRYREHGVVGFDIAGPELGFPAGRLADAFAYLRQRDIPFTVHAGEADGLDSIRGALQLGAARLGHGVRLAEDLHGDPAHPSLGPLAQQVAERQVALEVCPSSNLQTGVAASIAEHPFHRLAAAGLPVTVSTDNRLMSATTETREETLLAEAGGYDWPDLHRWTTTAMRAAFCEDSLKSQLLAEVITPAYQAQMVGSEGINNHSST